MHAGDVMDEPEQAPEEREQRGSLLPALLIAWVVLYLCVLLGMYWYECRLPADPALALRIHAFLLGGLALLFLVAMSGRRGEPAKAAGPEAWLCQHCLRPYVPGAHFCPRCGAPKTFYSGVPDFERAHHQAWILGKAAHHPSRPLHVVVLAVICLGELLWLGALAWETVLGGGINRTIYWVEFGGLLLWIVQAYIFCALFVLSWKSWRRRARGEEAVRPEIEYGFPPWFTFDAEWALPEFEGEPEEDEEGATPEAG